MLIAVETWATTNTNIYSSVLLNITKAYKIQSLLNKLLTLKSLRLNLLMTRIVNYWVEIIAFKWWLYFFELLLNKLYSKYILLQVPNNPDGTGLNCSYHQTHYFLFLFIDRT